MKILSDEKKLLELATDLAKEVKPKDIIILNGELGAGKTTFVKALAKQLGISKDITSPTFSIIKEYEDILCHIDAYRIFEENIDIDYYLDKNFIICIEWSQNIKDYIPYISYEININYTDDYKLREVEIIKKNSIL